MDHDLRVITIELGKQEEDDQSTGSQTPSTTSTPSPPPASYQRGPEPPYASSGKSCFVCQNTLLLSYFSCCAICLGIVERKPGSDPDTADERLTATTTSTTPDSLPLPITQPREPPLSPSPSSSSSSSGDGDKPPNTTTVPTSTAATYTDTGTNPPHCPSPYCRYTHTRPLLVLFALCEAIPSLGGLALLNAALYGRDWALLRFAGVLVLQWWQIFVLPRQWARGRSVVLGGQLVAYLFMVWFYVDASTSWRWWEPLAVSTVLLKIVFPW
ncbi:hypothetical protein F4811DRAFT_501423 [Daldinia bambusicola]|nr:hypothetical protein F4811DRAFT_501423 [Daldinia bambusicola]